MSWAACNLVFSHKQEQTNWNFVIKLYFGKFALCLFSPRSNQDSLEYLQDINNVFIVVARIFHILQLFCCTITWHLQSSCPMHFSSASCREVPWEAVRMSAVFTGGLWSPQTGNCLCSGHWLLFQHLSHLFYWNPCEKGCSSPQRFLVHIF